MYQQPIEHIDHNNDNVRDPKSTHLNEHNEPLREGMFLASNDTDAHIVTDTVTDTSNSSDNSDELPPAVRVPLIGQYLIEASAGTGKTWTLTGIVLRLLIEAKRAPEHIIATTFTRAAAAEMRQRIHERLVDFYQTLQWLNKLQANTETHKILYPQFVSNGAKKLQASSTAGQNNHETQKPNPAIKKITMAQQQTRRQWLIEQAALAGMADLLNDPINRHLIEYLLDNTENYPLADAIRRCALVLTTLDKLFVGTLDSLSQKWLSEYSSETGHQQGVQISDDEQLVLESIIHDTVRAHHSYLYHQQPKVYELLQHTKRLTAPADHLEVAKKSIQFISTPIEPVELGDGIDFVAYQQALDYFKQCDLTDVTPYFDKEYRKAQGFHGTASIGAKVDRIGQIQTAIEKHGMLFFVRLDVETQKFYDAIPHVFVSKEDGGKGFNANKEAERETFINLEIMQSLKKVYDQTEQLTLYLDSIIETLNRDIALKVRQKLPAILEERRETTFALQMVRLNQALSGKQGTRLARYIRHHYPVALIDESQDINGEQARMIERIYLAQSASVDPRLQEQTQESYRGFLLLVGDPKQAIYGFRGGDVANYNAMKARFDDKHMMSLNVNRRSNKGVVTALNHWFGRPHPIVDKVSNVIADGIESDSGKAHEKSAPLEMTNQLAQLGKGIYYQHITADKVESSVSWQALLDDSGRTETVNHTIDVAPNEADSMLLPKQAVSIIHLPADKDAKYTACELTALHIAALLGSGQTIAGRPIKPYDIGVLGRRKLELKQVEEMLSKLNIPTLETAERNVFDTPIAADLAALLEAMLRPHRRDIINRVLTSHFYQLSLDEVQQLMLSLDNDYITEEVGKPSYQDFQTYLKTGATHWQQGGVLSALHYLLGHNPLSPQAVHHQPSMQAAAKSARADNSNASIWVGLAHLTEGKRYLMDLRHLMDILAQHGMHIGEHELLAWYKKQMHSKHTPEWAQQQPLPTASGVQLMTIHKSKGLEFPVVYVVGMDGASRKADDKKGAGSKHKLYMYDHDLTDLEDKNIQTTERRLSASAGKPHSKSVKGERQTDYYAKFETIENYEERRRLAYVAFTRASEQLYIVVSDKSKNADNELKPYTQWLTGSDKKFVLPERLADHIGWLNAHTIARHADTIIPTLSMAKKSVIKNNSDANTQVVQRIDYQDAYAQLQDQSFKGWAKTSFTALSRQLSEQGKALAVFDDGIEDELDLTDSIKSATDRRAPNSSMLTADNIRFRFVKGANAGTFLHQIFERIDFNNVSNWSAVIDHGIRQYQLPLSYTSAHQADGLPSNQASTTSEPLTLSENAHQALIGWVADVLNAPLLASGQPLKSIAPKQRIAELGFNMGLAESFTPQQINDVFKAYLPDDPDKHIELSTQYTEHLYRYLRGEIDLVYEHGGKFYVVDYKSNYLGDSLSDYNADSLNAVMSKAGYWLQAAIYQVALHRFLRLRLHNYEGNEAQYLGAVEYVFLRGIDSQGTQDYGRIQWQMPFALVEALDKMFGIPNQL